MQAHAYESRNLDILRAIAVLSVVAYHCLGLYGFGGSLWKIGRFGVLIFFVHTSLVLLMSLERLEGSGAYFRRFYIQRLFRIYPLSIVCILVVLALNVPQTHLTLQGEPVPLKGIAASLLLMQNLLPGKVPQVSEPLWSLPFEIQMYLILPVIFVAVRLNKRNVLWLTAATVVIAATEHHFRPTIMGVAEFFPCFMGGVIAYTLKKRDPLFHWTLWPAFIGMVGVAYSLIPMQIPAAWGACIVLGCGQPFFASAPVGMIATAGHYVARYSYGIYLSHTPILWLAFMLLPLPQFGSWFLFVSLMAVVPALLFHFIEAPLIQAGRTFANRVAPIQRPALAKTATQGG